MHVMSEAGLNNPAPTRLRHVRAHNLQRTRCSNFHSCNSNINAEKNTSEPTSVQSNCRAPTTFLAAHCGREGTKVIVKHAPNSRRSRTFSRTRPTEERIIFALLHVVCAWALRRRAKHHTYNCVEGPIQTGTGGTGVGKVLLAGPVDSSSSRHRWLFCCVYSM